MRAATTLIIGLGLSGCLVEIDAPEAGDIPPRVQHAFDSNCAIPACHDAGTKRSGLSLEAGDSDAIIDGTALGSELPLVSLGDVDGSYLARKVLGAPGIAGEQMPPGGGADPEDIAVILGWIAGVEFPTEEGELTFTGAIAPIFEARCSCHQNGGSGVSTVDLDEDVAYENIVDVAYGADPSKFISPGSLKNSRIWLSVTGTFGLPMPLGGPPLSGPELQTLRDWILADAPE